MSNALPSVTVIIAARPDESDIRAVKAARQLDYPPDRLEILVARGKQPSVQRNAAVRAAHGEWVYFLDDDSIPRPDNLLRATGHFGDAAVQMVGGPNVCPPGAPLIERVFAVVLSSWLAFGPSRARYVATGRVRESGEKELILCNLMARRVAVLEAGGFNEALYPNEENALMDELRKRGGRLMYDPDFTVERRPRRTLRSFGRMLLTYGRGRAEQFRVHPTPGSALNFIPPLFCLYLVVAGLAQVLWFGRAAANWAAAPLGLYAAAIVVQTLVSLPRSGLAPGLLAAPLLAASHILYGLGFWRGLFTSLSREGGRPAVAVNLETVTR